MYIFELNDLIFFIKSYKSPSDYFNINDFIFCSSITTRSSTGFKLQHNASSNNLTYNFYFCRLPRLWNSLPIIDIHLPVTILKLKLQKFFGLISQVALMVTTLAHFTITALVPDVHVCHANQPEQFSNYILLIN